MDEKHMVVLGGERRGLMIGGGERLASTILNGLQVLLFFSCIFTVWVNWFSCLKVPLACARFLITTVNWQSIIADQPFVFYSPKVFKKSFMLTSVKRTVFSHLNRHQNTSSCVGMCSIGLSTLSYFEMHLTLIIAVNYHYLSPSICNLRLPFFPAWKAFSLECGCLAQNSNPISYISEGLV